MRRLCDHRHTGRGYLGLAMAVLAGLGLAEANGEVDTTAFALFCLGFFASRLLRRFFWDIGVSFSRMYWSAGYPRPQAP